MGRDWLDQLAWSEQMDDPTDDGWTILAGLSADRAMEKPSS